MRYEEVKSKHLKHGDQIAVKGNIEELSKWLLPLTLHNDHIYYHHGIFDKENMVVIDFYGDSKETAIPQERDFLEFTGGKTTLYRVVYENGEQCLSVDKTMEMAYDAVNKQRSWPTYDLIKNNCESFATYLKTGKKYSKQAFDALIANAPIVLGVAGVVFGGGSLGASGASGKRSKGLSVGSLENKSE